MAYSADRAGAKSWQDDHVWLAGIHCRISQYVAGMAEMSYSTVAPEKSAESAASSRRAVAWSTSRVGRPGSLSNGCDWRMATILVETRGELRCNPILDAMAAACTGAGHRVVRWRGPLSGRIAVSRRLKPCDVAILFNGTHAKYAPTVSSYATGHAILFVELGGSATGNDSARHVKALTADASWVGRPLTSIGRTPLECSWTRLACRTAARSRHADHAAVALVSRHGGVRRSLGKIFAIARAICANIRGISWICGFFSWPSNTAASGIFRHR